MCRTYTGVIITLVPYKMGHFEILVQAYMDIHRTQLLGLLKHTSNCNMRS
jgi:hypothetical protein